MFRNFNVENRARREISKEKPTPAPRHRTARLDTMAGECQPRSPARGAAPAAGAASVGAGCVARRGAAARAEEGQGGGGGGGAAAAAPDAGPVTLSAALGARGMPGAAAGRLTGTGAITAGSSVREEDGGGRRGRDGDRSWGQLMGRVVPETVGGGGAIGGSCGGGMERLLRQCRRAVPACASRCAVTGDRPSPTVKRCR